ncbi:uncharacterized protein GGS25DRAFT_193259 [Hypoxylon fragiforme]|uniref:uncharacterized protein n=1 Tax=Hypoxylon fragiforme TaxID=63214 RepID=UPI0020C6D80E|nr:uncharacterized protein GGS25DRAFT_193259 [Hypoxylon fragiforme]KAI2611377.1 hypothetical protein GGS25DRAFT_193259 [Hypoxylon fragiforme]
MDAKLFTTRGRLAASVYDQDGNDLAADIDRWQTIFGFTPAEAEMEIRDRRSSTGCKYLGFEPWELNKDSLKGFYKEAYEYALATERLPTTLRNSTYIEPKSTFLLKLEGLFSDVEVLKIIGNLDSQSAKYRDGDADGDVEFCVIDATEKRNIEKSLLYHCIGFQPTYIRISTAEKNLPWICRHPTLGVDSTMPQYRLQSQTETPAPIRNECPVWYFFYGTLADKDVLTRVLQREISTAEMKPAQVRGGGLITRAGKDRATIHADLEASPMAGSAYIVKTREEKYALRFHKTDRYAVVRCRIQLIAKELGTLEGMDRLTFLFLG